MKSKFKPGSKIEWKWMGSTISGTVEEVHFKSIKRIIKGKTITRNGSPEKPAYVVKSEAGNLALKLESELTAPMRKKSNTPSMF